MEKTTLLKSVEENYESRELMELLMNEKKNFVISVKLDKGIFDTSFGKRVLTTQDIENLGWYYSANLLIMEGNGRIDNERYKELHKHRPTTRETILEFVDKKPILKFLYRNIKNEIHDGVKMFTLLSKTFKDSNTVEFLLDR